MKVCFWNSKEGNGVLGVTQDEDSEDYLGV